ncbi:MAG: hypothetical protein HUU15_18100, partial [Candidatus Brocadiae bacterium]|nr:hypothetical protein [Candidatus Brocadiia bacterium]
PHHRPAELDADLARLREAGADSNALVVQARALVLAGRDREAVDLLSSKGRRTHFSTLFWLGAAYWKLGRLAEARVVLQDARRLNPHLAKHAARLPGLADFLASVAPESGGDRARLGYELATHLLTVAEIETLVRAYRFRRAAAEYEALLAAVTSGTRKADIAARLPEVRAMAAALDRIVAAVNRGQPRLKARVGGADLTLQKADEAAFDFTIPKGSGRFPWAFVGPAALLDMVSSCAAPPDDLFGLACVAWEAGEPDLAVKTFEEAAKHRPELRPAVAAFVARQRGIPVPAGGFALHQGRYVTPEEKARLSEGLVLFEGRWVTPKDRAQLARGLVRAGDRWVAGDEAELLRLGFRRHRGEWMSPGDYEALRGTWAEAWTADTAHFAIRTNQGEAFARDLASLLEAAWQDMHAVYGDGPKLKEKVAVLAFRTFEDWRTWCRDNRQEASLNAAGLARSDAGTVAGWNKSRNEQQFLQTMVHETAHLFWNRLAPAARTPSWYAEGMATEFEGFDWTGKEWRWDHVADTRVAFIRGAVKGRRQLPLQDLFGGDALALINSDMSRALLFYAQCWSVVHFLRTTDNPKWRAAGEAYRKELAAGGTRGLPHFLGDTAAFEKDWMAFVAGM